MLYVGVDPSITNTGMVLLDEVGKPVKWYNGNLPNAKNREPIHRYSMICHGLCATLPWDAPEFVVGYEDYSFGSTHRAFALAEFGGILKYSLLNAGAKMINLFAPMWNKKFATGDGTADKQRMIAKAIEECPEFAGETSDVCDAYFLAKAAWYATAPEDIVIENETNKSLLRPRMEMVKEWKKKQK